MSDYIRLPRSALSDDLWRDGNIARLYLYLLSKVDEPMSFRDAVKNTGLSLQQVRTAIDKLKKAGKITQIATQKTTQIATQIKLCDINDKSRRVTQIATQIPTQVSTQANSSIEDYVDPRFEEAWNMWLAYRREKNSNYKSKTSERTAYRKMVKMANGNPAIAMDMVERAILGQWQGLHETQSYGTRQQGNSTAAAKESRDRLRHYATEIVSRSSDLLNLYNGQGSDSDNS